MSKVTFIRRGHKMALCLTNHMCGEIVAGAGYVLHGKFDGITELVLVNQSMYDAIVKEAPGEPDEDHDHENKPGGSD
jgi:hypothetical protein